MLAHAHGLVVAHLTALVELAAVLEVGARVAALARLPMAGQARRALGVALAADPWPVHRAGADAVATRVCVARRLRLADVALGTRAAWLVQHDAAQGVYAAGTAQGAWIQALGVYARFFVRALLVARAFLL